MESVEGRGTTIYIMLPLVDAEFEDATDLREGGIQAKQPLSGLRVMIVDDEHTMAAMLSEFLSLNGAIVTTHTQSSEALREYMRKPDAIDIVVTDQIMPEMTGLDMAQRMLKVNPVLPIIICTGYSQDLTQENVIEQGISMMMHKPLKVSLLIENILHLSSKKDNKK